MTVHRDYANLVARQLQLRNDQVLGTINLLNEGATIPFISRYRKEATGSLDEVAITAIRDHHQKLVDLDKRRMVILESLQKNQHLTPSLQQKVQQADSLSRLEDIYRPYKPKRTTRAAIARQKGLAPLADTLTGKNKTPSMVSTFIDQSKGVHDKAEALAGARDIIAEEISEDEQTRSELRDQFSNKAIITSKVVKKNIEVGIKFQDYFEWHEPANKAPGHRLLAMFRGEREKILSLSVRPPLTDALRLLKKRHLKTTIWQEDVSQAIEDSYQRLLAPSLENEHCRELKAKADLEAIQVFTDNLRQLLLAAPLGQKNVIALDPGYRTGAKVVCLDSQGALLDNTVIYPTHGGRKLAEAAATITKLVSQYKIEAIAIGNGTAGRETEEFIRNIGLNSQIIITLVNEDGASIYSASEQARAEFPEHDLTVRGAISIGRRLQDPLAELVKIDPKSIGVGQYQHDINQNELKKGLQDVVESCVNSVGVELNSASAELLTSVSGLGPTLADNIVSYREANGPFSTRQELQKVPRLGPKAFEQCAGFLRIGDGTNPLDASAVHPERYRLVKKMACEAEVTLPVLIQSASARNNITLEKYTDNSVGMPTLLDILSELAKPGRDPRNSFEQFRFAEGIHTMEDLHKNMILPAIITNVTKFGAFADVGIKQDGLIHISQLADRFIKDPAEIVRINQRVQVRVVDIDIKRKRIALSMRIN